MKREEDADKEINGSAWSKSDWGEDTLGGGRGRGGVVGLDGRSCKAEDCCFEESM